MLRVFGGSLPPAPDSTMRFLAFTVLTALSACSGPGSLSDEAPSRPRSQPVSSEEALADFDAVWEIIRDQHFDPDFGGVDWDAVRVELRPQAARAQNQREVRLVIVEMLDRLGQSHFNLISKQVAGGSVDATSGEWSASASGGVGIDLRWRGGQLLVTRVEAGSPAELAGVELGWALEEIDGNTLTRVPEVFEGRDPRYTANGMRQLAQRAMFGAIGSKAEFLFHDLEGSPNSLHLARRRRDIRTSQFGNLPNFQLEFWTKLISEGDQEFGLIHFSNWFLPVAGPIDEAIDEFRDCDGLILDLRGNGGGALALVMGLAGHFFEDRRALGTHMQREQDLTYRANPRLVNTAGERVSPGSSPLAILVDETSGSASEVFAGGLQSIGRARVFGEISMGAVLPSRTSTLPSGDVLLHAFADFLTPDGTRLEGRGVVPDELVPMSRESLAGGHDPQLQAAIMWLATASSPR